MDIDHLEQLLGDLRGGAIEFTARDMDRLVRSNEGHGVHSYEPSAVSMTQSTESGTIYSPEEISGICEQARKHGMGRALDVEMQAVFG